MMASDSFADIACLHFEAVTLSVVAKHDTVNIPYYMFMMPKCVIPIGT